MSVVFDLCFLAHHNHVHLKNNIPLCLNESMDFYCLANSDTILSCDWMLRVYSYARDIEWFSEMPYEIRLMSTDISHQYFKNLELISRRVCVMRILDLNLTRLGHPHFPQMGISI